LQWQDGSPATDQNDIMGSDGHARMVGQRNSAMDPGAGFIEGLLREGGVPQTKVKHVLMLLAF
jgi:hypothetical protein